MSGPDHPSLRFETRYTLKGVDIADVFRRVAPHAEIRADLDQTGAIMGYTVSFSCGDELIEAAFRAREVHSGDAPSRHDC